jgi:hypothetical protein
LGAVAQFEKQALVAKLRKARERKRSRQASTAAGIASPRRSLKRPLVKELARYLINGCRRSLREIAAVLEAAGHATSKGTPYGAAAIARMIA